MRLRSWPFFVLLCLAGCATTPAGPILWRSGLWCGGTEAQQAAARANAASLANLPIDLFGRPETGWAVYAPTIQDEINSRCGPAEPGFAGAVSLWQGRQGLPASGIVDAATLVPMKAAWQGRRPFLASRAAGACPAPPPESALATAEVGETLGDRPVRLRAGALAAYRRLAAAARAEDPAIAADPNALKLFSGFRDPAADEARCATEHNCQGVVRASCSPHRTGLAVDLMVGAAPGFMADSSDDTNRLFQSKSPAYRWLVRNAGRFGFVNYVFEPWHWEWTGEAP